VEQKVKKSEKMKTQKGVVVRVLFTTSLFRVLLYRPTPLATTRTMTSYCSLLFGFLFVALLPATTVHAKHHPKQHLRGAIPSAAYNQQAETTTTASIAAPEPAPAVPLPVPSDDVPPVPLPTEDASEDIPMGEVVWGGTVDDGVMHMDEHTGAPPPNPCPANQCPYNCGYDDEGDYSCFCGLCA
jgi:hypothetical protein